MELQTERPGEKASVTVAARMGAAQLDSLYQAARIGILIEPLVSICLAVLIWPAAAQQQIALWLVAVNCLVGLRFAAIQRDVRDVGPGGDTDSRALPIMMIIAVSGVIWGLAPLVLPTNAASIDMAKVLCATAAIGVAGTVMMSCHLTAALIWLGVTSGALLTGLLVAGRLDLQLALTILVASGALAVGARHLSRLLDDGLRLRFELADAVKAAQAANIAKSDFLANTSHELRTPLNAIIGFSEILMNDRPRGDAQIEEQMEFARLINESGVHLLDIVNDILDLSKIEAGAYNLDESVFTLDSVVRTTTNLMRGQADKAGLRLVSDLAPDLPAIRGDQRAMKQILLNLLSNAVKFTPIGGSVTVQAGAAEEGGLLIAVVDTGIGIAPEDITRAMEAFGQVDSALNRRYAGTGLGLPLVRSLIEMHGGRFQLVSRVNEGTRAEILWPPARVVGSGRRGGPHSGVQDLGGGRLGGGRSGDGRRPTGSLPTGPSAVMG
ncbi:HAMP domain-containing sensor histidine kinase [Tistrella bauzanensis]|uniref:histidine kinase n=1 Tax=Tistrella arctica TaxID=3133430 RepID=A0ABU9YQU1_9PROT